jgi:hypothetical protein
MLLRATKARVREEVGTKEEQAQNLLRDAKRKIEEKRMSGPDSLETLSPMAIAAILVAMVLSFFWRQIMQQPWVVALLLALAAPFAFAFQAADEKALEAEYQTKEKEKVRAEMSRILCLADEWQGMGAGAADPTKPKAKQAFDALVDDVEGDVVARFKLTPEEDREMLKICTRTKALLGECFQEEMAEELLALSSKEGVESLESGSKLEELSVLGDKILQTKILQSGSLGGECIVDAHTLQAVRAKHQVHCTHALHSYPVLILSTRP